MKLATYRDGSRNGQLVVVSADLSTAHYATGVANTLQQVLDDWRFLAPQLQDIAMQLNAGRARHAFAFQPQLCMAPLPRMYHWACAQPGPQGITLSHHAGDDVAGACDEVRAPADMRYGDMDAGLSIIAGDIRMGTAPEQALDAVRLVMLSNAMCSREPTPAGTSPTSPDTAARRWAPAFSPVACTPDALGAAWQQGRVHLTLQTMLNGRKLGLRDAHEGMTEHFGLLLARLAQTRHIRAGAVVSASLSAPTDTLQGHTCLAHKRHAEWLRLGKATTPYLRDTDTLRIDMKTAAGASVFGAIEQTVTAHTIAATGGFSAQAPT